MSAEIRWSEAALQLFALSGPTAVSAGAGSGKTTCLVELCVRLFAGEATGRPCAPGEVVAITFTEKAALELEERLRQAVAARARAAPAGSGAAREWQLRLRELERMAVGTIHGFAGALLREHALEAGLDPDFTVADEETAQAWRREAAQGAVLAALDAGQPEVVAMVGAQGAGGGARSGLADLVAELVRERAALGDTGPPRPAPDRTEEALGARASALEAARVLLGARGAVRTASGTRALALLEEAAARLDPVDRGGTLRAEGLHRIAALGEAVRGWRVGGSDGAARSLREELVRACGAFQLAATESLAGPQKRELCALVAEAERRYAERKGRSRAVDFDDLLLRARDLLRSDAALRAELRGRLRALLVDEYQDVNGLQQELFELLAGGGEPGPIAVAVGDLKQSIYRFRGADVAVFRGVVERLGRPREGGGAPEGRVLHLVHNHRSSAAVLEVVNEVFSRCMRAGADPRPYELHFAPSDRLLPVRVGGARPACEILDDGEGGSAADRRRREARALAARIGALTSGAAGVEVRERDGEGGERPRRPRHGDVAVLFRRLTQLGEYERALREAGIPYRLARGGGFYQAPEVRELGELLASLADPQDGVAWAALLRSALCGLSDGALFAVSRLGFGTLAGQPPGEAARRLVERYPAAAEPWPDLAGAGAPGRASTEAERFARFLSEWSALRALHGRLAPAELLRRAVERLDLEAAHLAAPDGERRLANARKVVALAERFARGQGTAAALAAHLRAQADRPPREPEAELEAGDAVALLSVHQAKGLEWPIVFVPDLGATPPADTRRARRDPAGALAACFLDPTDGGHHPTAAIQAAREEARRAEAAEQRRLLYVALTRARDRLVLSGEAGRSGESWRTLVEAGLAGRPDLALRVPVGEAASFRAGPPVAGPGHPELAPPPAPPLSLRMRAAGAARAAQLSVTELAEYARCPRRLFLGRHLGLAEPPGEGGAVTGDDPGRATARGSLAHAMLAETDLAATPLERRAQLAAAASRRGYDPAAPAVRRVLAEMSRFLDSAGGARLRRAAREGALRREVPFLLKVEGGEDPDCYLVGAIDALVEGDRTVSVIDFKYAVARPGAAERYRTQLLAYVLALSRARPGRRVTATLQFLRAGCAAVDLTPSEAELRRFAREAPRLAAALLAGRDLTRAPGQLGRLRERCQAEGCGHVERCHGRA